MCVDATVPKGEDLKRAIEETKAHEDAAERQRQQEMAAAAMLLEQQKQEEVREVFLFGFKLSFVLCSKFSFVVVKTPLFRGVTHMPQKRRSAE